MTTLTVYGAGDVPVSYRWTVELRNPSCSIGVRDLFGFRTMREIAEEVARRHRLTLADLKGPRRTQTVILARQEAMWAMRQVMTPDGLHRYSLPQIGRFLGGRDHTTIIHGVRAHEGRMVDGDARRKTWELVA